ncbi:DUF484 family protein, partial [Neisseria dentiae]|uniref:DUF484 family protein n=2 Tax=Neisseria dentiae TaxID=194197 RepID=UPI0035A0F765
MNKENVLAFLREHPDFLAEHADELGIRLRDEKVRSFAQAQVAASQLKIEKMAAQLKTMLADSEANRTTMLRQLALDVQLLGSNTAGQLIHALYRSLQEDFGLQQFVLKIAVKPKNKARIPDEAAVFENAKISAEIVALKKPLLGNKISKEMQALLPDDCNTVAESFLQLPIPIGGGTGAVLLAADADVNRFAEGLATESVEYMAAAVGAALSRIMGYR